MIADGAAFGSEIDRVLQLIKSSANITLYLPESFEWLLLTSGIFKEKEIARILEEPSDYIESRKYFSWERFFTALLIEKSQDTYLRYLNFPHQHGVLNLENSIFQPLKKA